MKELGDAELPEDVLAVAAMKHVTSALYDRPTEYRRELEKVFSMKENYLSDMWPQYVEMKARRDVGLHGNWQRNRLYDTKIREVGLTPPSQEFLGVSFGYFTSSLRFAKQLLMSMTWWLRSFGLGTRRSGV